jgi:8-oxo-dGTP diphosphatase
MSQARTVEDVNWAEWRPAVRATLLFIVQDGQVLLIRKKRGLGAGKINAPGGRIEPGESPVDCAVRETIEEVGLHAHPPQKLGELWFEFVDGLRLFVTAFRADGCDGDAIETDEAVPLWTPIDAIPYDEMWADDQYWVPHLLAGRAFQLRAVFDDDTMLDFDLRTAEDMHSA